MFFRQISDAVGATDDREVLLAIWELVWAGHVTNDTLDPLRVVAGAGVRISGGRSSRPRRRRGPALPRRMGPPAGGGRWSLVPAPVDNPTARAHALAEQLIARHGVLTRGAATAERTVGGFAGVYGVLKAMEESGRIRRGYFVEGLGGAQFALAGAVDRMRAGAQDPTRNDRPAETLVLSATDPANPYGAAVPWPERPGDRPGHRPGRKAGALVVLTDGRLTLYVEKGGRSFLTFSDDAGELQPAVDALSLAVREGFAATLTVERVDGREVFETPLAELLTTAGSTPSTRGLRLRGSG